MKTRIVLFGSFLALLSAAAVAQEVAGNVGKTKPGETMGGAGLMKPGRTVGGGGMMKPGRTMGRGGMMKPTAPPKP